MNKVVISRVPFIEENLAAGTNAGSSDEAGTPLPSPTVERYRRNAAFLLPSMAIVFAALILVATVIGLVLGGAAARTQVSTATELVLSTSQIKIGENYSTTSSGFLPGENVQFS